MKLLDRLATPMLGTGSLCSMSSIMLAALLSLPCVAQEYYELRAADESAEITPPLIGPYGHAATPPGDSSAELIPPPPQASAPTASPLPEGCLPAPEDPPLESLTIDIVPLDPNGQIVPESQLPENCAKYVYTQQRFQQFALTCCELNICDLLQLANYDRRPLYFEEKALEKCGIRSCYCQPAKSACQFYGTALLMPCKMMAQCPCTTYVPDGPCY